MGSAIFTLHRTPNDAIWRSISWATLRQVMTCLVARLEPNHHLNQCCLIVNSILGPNLHQNKKAIFLFKKLHLKMSAQRVGVANSMYSLSLQRWNRSSDTTLQHFIDVSWVFTKSRDRKRAINHPAKSQKWFALRLMLGLMGVAHVYD